MDLTEAEDIPNPGIEPESSVSPTAQADSLPTEPSGKPIDTHNAMLYMYLNEEFQRIARRDNSLPQ